MKVLITNDDGIGAKGINALRQALARVPDVELSVIAPDSNRSATARSITTRSPLWVEGSPSTTAPPDSRPTGRRSTVSASPSSG
jgi:5'/3'-nucleotidase SurE